MNDLDARIRAAFEAVELPPDHVAPAESRRAGWVQAAVVLLTLGVVALPVATRLLGPVVMGLLGWPAQVDLLLPAPFDGVPPGPVHVTCAGEDLGIQELVRPGARARLAIREPVMWGQGCDGDIQLAELDGPLRLVRVRDLGLEVEPGQTLGAGDPYQVAAVDGDVTVLRMEVDAYVSPSPPVSRSPLSLVDLGLQPSRVRRVPSPEGVVDKRTGMPLGHVGRGMAGWSGGVVVTYEVMSGYPLEGRDLQLVGMESPTRWVLWLAAEDAEAGDRLEVRVDGVPVAVTEAREVDGAWAMVAVPAVEIPRIVRGPTRAFVLP
ncbi:MAG: hypothetical protein H6736_05590 [Alphaproteobacteria bacterium]|nr:hypothetical protein [Alphaproteobacteria bacterium]